MKKTTLIIASFLGSLFAFQQSKAQMFVVDTVPLIIHVVHNGEAVGSGHNLSQAQVMSQFQVLNADFAGQGWNVGNVPPVWASLVANTGIVFVPAMVDTNGVPLAEPGIDRIDRNTMGWMNTATINTASGLQTYMDNTIKPQSIWDHNSYCNVWLIDMANTGLLGYSTFPANSGLPWITGPTATATNDGVCIHYTCWGDTLNVSAPYNHGRTATHEFGHWLGLRHMQNGCVPQDVADIPIGEYDQWFGGPPVFPDVADTCAGYPDGPMFMNFMCFAGSDSDIYMFTNAQGNAMRQGLTNGHGTVTSSGVWHLTSVKQLNQQSAGFVVYPNPTSGVLNIRANAVYNEVSIKVFNALGQTIYGKYLGDWTGSHTLSLSRQKSGMYFVEITTEGKTTVQKIILE